MKIPIKTRIIIVFGEMASGKSTTAKELAYNKLNLTKDRFFEGDDVLNLPELSDLKAKVIKNEPLNSQDINRLVSSLINEIRNRTQENSTLVVAQALYSNRDRQKIIDEFGKENVSFVWVRTPFLKHITQLFFREYSAYLKDKTPSIMNYFYAVMNGVKSIRTHFLYSLHFEKPAGYFTNYSSWTNYFNGQKTLDAVPAFVINNNKNIEDLLETFNQLPFVINPAKFKSQIPFIYTVPSPVPALKAAPVMIKRSMSENQIALIREGLFKMRISTDFAKGISSTIVNLPTTKTCPTNVRHFS